MALSILVAWCVILKEILISIECAPKLGSAIYDPLSFEAAEFKDIDEDFLSNDRPTLSVKDKSTNTETNFFLLKINFTNEYTTKTTTKQKRMTHEFEKTSSALPNNTIIESHISKQKAYELTNYKKSFTKSKIYKILRRDNKCNGTNSCDASGNGIDPTNCKTVGDRILCGYDKNIGTPNNYDAPGVNLIEYNMENMTNDCIIRGDRIECGYSNPPFTRIRRPSLLRTPFNSKSQLRNKRKDTLQTSTKKINLHIAAMTETTTETTKFTTETITSTSIASQRTTPETTLMASQRNDNDTFTTSSIMTETTTETTKFTTEAITSTNITSQRTSPETTLAASQRNDNDTFITSSINIEAYTPSTSDSTLTESTLAALRNNENESTTGSIISTSHSTSKINIDTNIPSTISSSTTYSTTSSSFNTESTVIENPSESIGPMKCFEKDDRIVCYDLE